MTNRLKSRWLSVGVTVVGLAGALGLVSLAPSAGAVASSLRDQTIQAAPALPPGAVATGELAADTPLRLSVILKPRDPAALSAFALAVSTPGSRLYRHFLTRGQFGPDFGPAQSTVRADLSALRSLGLRPGRISSNLLDISIVTTAAAAEAAFRVRLHTYRLADGRDVYANATAP